ncbi:IspD/TarI family cytidylyltransferase [Arcobacter sp. FWKO B]|uniref:IspD/TarI family cytidylyltransferase n=1 Tax=Arcobacter sp. FWKO B TaxID=2593672 RepID=UPI0018A5CD77|nr:IspD/TarI family cytidylyltransferase [Arcobacter sp. FWKO B]QOG11269.1 2-C-methyl-D-erythritol 4-phosphate cytidylyltransferase [Arcobacter sp. FWKO B]
MSYYSLILLSGGIGSRMNSTIPKQLIELKGNSIILYSLMAVKANVLIKEIIINYPKGMKSQIKALVKISGIDKKIVYVEAGLTRQESVYNMLKKATYSNVIIHESARPLVDAETFYNLISSEYENCGYMIEIPFTVLEVDTQTKQVVGSFNRDKLRNVLLPQKFNTKKLLEAHELAIQANLNYTEDASLLIENSTIKFHFLEGSNNNIKITYPSDLVFAEAFLDIKNSVEE